MEHDTLGRPLADLRLSVTDRCNFRCAFCMPAEERYTFLPRPELLSFEEVARLARLFVEMGVGKIRLTGGEPLLRAEVEKLVALLAAIPGLEDLALTTNGLLLAGRAEILKRAGLDRVTVSLHSLDPATFDRLSGGRGDLERVLAGLEAARRAGLAPIKLNAVVIRGVNDGEIVALARFARRRGMVLRFIEYMDVGTLNRWSLDGVVSARQILERLDAAFPLEAVGRAHPGEVAERYRYRDGGPEVGVIPAITQPFCGACGRARLSADGRLFTCLFASEGHDLKGALRSGASDGELAELIAAVWRRRGDRYSEERAGALAAGRPPAGAAAGKKVEMFRIGG